MVRTLGRGFAALVLATPLTGLALIASPAGAAPCTISGTAGNDVLTGTTGPDVLCGLGGNDILRGLAGDDELQGGDGNDTLWPGRGSNAVVGGAGTDTLRYDDLATGTVEVRLSAGTVTGAVTDTVMTVENVVGTGRPDRLVGSSGPNRLEGLGGNDVLVGRDGDDRLVGSEGSDVIQPGRGDDTADGTGFFAPEDVDTISYRDLTGGGVRVDLEGRTATGVTAGVDAITRFVNIVGTAADDVLLGDGVANRIHGLGGDDSLRPSSGGRPDQVHGGDGQDVLDLTVTGFGFATTLNLALGTFSINGRPGTFDGIEDVLGGLGPDTITGDAGPNWISGGSGNDTIDGAGGDDTMLGGPGNDSFVTNGGFDFILGGSESNGQDSLSYATETSWISADLGDGIVYTTADGLYDTISGIERLVGTTDGDNLIGGLGEVNVTLIGQGGLDIINTTDGFAGDRIEGVPPSSCGGDPGDTIIC